MKLTTKTNYYYISGMALIFLSGGFIFLYLIKKEINHELKEQLLGDKLKIERQIAGYDSIPEIFLSVGDILHTDKVNSEAFNNNLLIIDTLLYNDFEEEELPYRQLKFFAKSKLYTYHITLSKSLIETDDLAEEISKALIILFILFLLFIFILNSFISKRVWAPFNETLKAIKNYSLAAHSTILLSKTDVNEFKELNRSIKMMTDKIHKDYKSLKEFTENASHEIQTPLAIITSKLEYLIQQDNLPVELLKTIRPVYAAAGRLSKLNQSLLLITKIENNQFAQKEQVDLHDVLTRQLENYKELIEVKGLKINTDIAPQIYFPANMHLVEILIENLFTNAIKHNIPEGEISIELDSGKLSFTNTGPELNHDPTELFNRFKKNNESSDSLGLGLSIVKKICEITDIKVIYRYDSPYHNLIISF